MSLKDFEIGKELGKGAFGTVCFVKRIEDKKMYAMKRVKISQLNTKERENALNEVRILASLNHPNIVGYKEAFFDEDTKTLCIVMEFADDGDLESKIQKNIKSKGTFSEAELWKWLVQIIQGLKYLHENKIMHRDLKCANIFLMKNGTLKLGDLNVSKIVKMGMCSTQTGTPYYASPEVWSDKPYDYKSDLWSVGCILYELCVLRPPFRAQSLDQLCRNVIKGVYDKIPNTFSKDMSDIIGMMLQTNPARRPSCEDLLKHDIILRRTNPNKEIVENNVRMEQPLQLLGTIKLPKNLNEINQKLPKKKMYIRETEQMMMENIDINSKKKIEINLPPSALKPANQPLAGNPQQPQLNNNNNNNINNNNYNLNNNLININNNIGNAKPLTPNNNANPNLINLNNRSPLPNNINNINSNNNANYQNNNNNNNININLARNNSNQQQNQIPVNNGINGIRPSSAKPDPKARLANQPNAVNNYQNPLVSPINNQKNNLNLNLQPNSNNSPIMINANINNNNNNNKGPVIASYNPINNMNLNQNQNRPGSGVAASNNNNNKDISSNVNNYLKKVNNLQQNQNPILAGNNNYHSNNQQQQQVIKRPSSGRPDSAKGALNNNNNNYNYINRNNVSPIRSPNNMQIKPALIGNYQSNPSSNRPIDKSPVNLAKKPLIAAVDNSPKPLLRPQSGNPGLHNNNIAANNRPQSDRYSNPISNNNNNNRKVAMPAGNRVVIEKYDMNKLQNNNNNNYNRVVAGNIYKPSTPSNRPASGNANNNNRNVVVSNNNRNNVVMPPSRGNVNANIVRAVGPNKR